MVLPVPEKCPYGVFMGVTRSQLDEHYRDWYDKLEKKHFHRLYVSKWVERVVDTGVQGTLKLSQQIIAIYNSTDD